jgi:Mg-chelatase subunit ChlD
MLSFDRPWYLVLLILVPLLVGLGGRSLSGMGRVRRILVLVLRATVVTLIVMALAEASWVRSSDRMTVVYLLDRSLSIPESHRQRMLEYVNLSVARHWQPGRQDRVGVIVFGRDAAVEIPPVDDRIEVGPRIESLFDAEQSDLSAALQMSLALLPQDTARRVVLVSDGNENRGDARQAAQAVVERGIGIDAVPIEFPARHDVALERLTLPPDIHRGEPFDLRVVLRADGDAATDGASAAGRGVQGRVRVVRKSGDAEVVLADESIEVASAKQVLSLRDQIDASNFYTYEARFVADEPAGDAVPQNNIATAFTHVRGQGAVLLIEDWNERGEFDHLVESLRRENLEVEVIASNQVFASLADLQRYDTIIMANVPRSSGEDAATITQFSDEQVRMMVRNTQQMGSGLLLIGGPNSFGAGGWTHTELERAMPVDFAVKNKKVVPVGALMLVIDSSGSMTGEKLAMSKRAAIASAQVLGSSDYVGVVTFDTEARSIVPMQRITSLNNVLARIDRIGAGGGTNMEPGMSQGYRALESVTEAAVKHMVVLTDGKTHGSGYEQMAAAMQKKGITTTCVAAGREAAVELLNRIATAGRGRFYLANNNRAIPRIFVKEAMKVAQPVLYEPGRPVRIDQRMPHEMLKGIDAVPPVRGFVMTTVKEGPLPEILLAATEPALENATILAGWQYGLGKAVVFTSDAGRRWATAWTEWPQYDKLFSQIVRWSMRPSGDSGPMSLATQIHDGTAQVVVTVQDEVESRIIPGNLYGSVIGPDMQPFPLSLTQTAVGRYEGSFAAQAAGSYFVMVQPAAGKAPLRAGVNVGYSDEFRNLESNRPLLESIATLRPPEGPSGQIASPLEVDSDLEELLAIDPFRRDLPPATTRRAVWPLCVMIGSAIFFSDVLVRRVRLDLSWIVRWAERLWQSVRRATHDTSPADAIRRLQRRKAELAADIARKKASTAMLDEEPPVDAAVLESSPGRISPADGAIPSSIAPGRAAARQATATPAGEIAGDSPAEETVAGQGPSYTERLLAAKRKVWERRDSN